MLLGISSRMFDSNEKKRLHYWECFFHSYGAFFLQLALNHTWLIRARVFTLAKLKLSTIKITKTGRQINEPNIYIYIWKFQRGINELMGLDQLLFQLLALYHTWISIIWRWSTPYPLLDSSFFDEIFSFSFSSSSSSF